MTDAFQLSLARDRSAARDRLDEALAIEQRIDRMEQSMGDMKDMVGRVLAALVRLNAAAGLGSPTI